MLKADDGDPALLEPLVASCDKRIRAAAIAALTRHAGPDAPRWFARGLKDPDPCVRVETARRLADLDPAAHRKVFDLALHDPDPDVVRRARKLAAGKGFRRV